MAQTETTPYDRMKAETSKAAWPWKMFSFTLFILIIVVIVYAGLTFGYGPFLKKRITAVDAELNSLATKIPQEDQDNFIAFYSQLANVQNLLKQHVVASPVFPLLEKNTGERVQFVTMDLNIAEKRVNLEGTAGSYEMLTQQLDMLSKLPEINRYSIAESQLVEGRVRFRVIIFLNDSFFTKT